MALFVWSSTGESFLAEAVAPIRYVVVIGFAVSFYVLPYGLTWFGGALLLHIVGILLFAPNWLR